MVIERLAKGTEEGEIKEQVGRGDKTVTGEVVDGFVEILKSKYFYHR